MQCVFRTYDETATPDIEFVAQCAMFLTHNYLLIRHGVEYVRQNDMLLSNTLDKKQSEYLTHEKAPSGYFRPGLS